MAVNESLRHVAENGTNTAVERAAYRVVQTPQVFEADLLRLAYEIPYNSSFTDDASLVELTGQTIHLVTGSADNIKITQPMDLVIAAKLLG
jgi:2-C-methyl-D-erythritol 4-phosphate cytidylyltransferase